MTKNTKPYYVRPLIPENTHPVESYTFVINSPPITELYDKILKWLKNKHSGGIVYGIPRIGKTEAIKHIRMRLADEYGTALVTFIFNCSKKKNPTADKFYKECLISVNHYFSSSGDEIEKRERLVTFIANATKDIATRRVVIFIDEAQKLSNEEYEWLVDLYKCLVNRKIFPVFILIGQHELANRRNVAVLAGQFQIIGRFMSDIHKFRGLKSQDEILECLSQFDEGSEYPEGSGWSFTKYYFPAAFTYGWRLSSQSGIIWKAFNDIIRQYKLPRNDGYGIPMQYFISAVCSVLRGSSNLEATDPQISLNSWKEAIEDSGFHTARDLIRVSES